MIPGVRYLLAGTGSGSSDSPSKSTDEPTGNEQEERTPAMTSSASSSQSGDTSGDRVHRRDEEGATVSGGLKSAYANNVPHGLIGLSLLLSGVVVAEALAYLLLPVSIDIVAIANMLTSFPFIVILGVVGYSLLRGRHRVDRYPRIGAWTTAGLLFLGIFFTLIAVATQDVLLTQVGVVRWGAAAGAGAGALAGFFEARAIERAVTAERARIRNSELQRQNERLDDFANIIAHDLRNPLSVVTGRVEMAWEATNDPNLDPAMSSLKRMEQIIEETLTLARSGAVIDEPRAVDLEDLANQSWRNVETDEATLEIEDPPTISADRDRLLHLFENLFRNAIEHGRSDVTLRVGALPDGFYVEDNGSGIPETDRETVFEAGHSTSPGGTGFGLAIVKQIVDAHGWNIAITESPAGGARFEVTQVTAEEARSGDGSVGTPRMES